MSKVWNYFEKHLKEKDSVKCKLCSKILAYNGSSTSSMMKHLKGVHKNDDISLDNNQKETTTQSTMSSFVVPTKCKLPSEKITSHIVDMIVEDCLPLSIVHGTGFTKLMNFIAPGYDIPCANTMRNRITKLFDVQRECLKKVVYEETCGITADHWTSITNDPYITVTCHFIDSDWDLHSYVLETKKAGNRHTKVNISQELKNYADEWGIDVIALVHDNAKNMVGAAELCNEIEPDEWNSVPCGAHTLQLCIKPIFEITSVSHLVSKSRKLVGHFKHSSVATLALKERQPLTLIQDCSTRWNSTFYMLSRLSESRRAITDVLLDESVSKQSDLSLLLKDNEWELLNSLLPCLRPLEMATTALSAEKYVSVSMLYPIVFGLINVHLRTSSDDTSVIKKVKDSVRNQLVTRFKTNSRAICSSVPILASALDPRFKSLTFLSQEQRELTLDELEDRIPFSNNNNEPPAKKRKVSALSFLMGSSQDIGHTQSTNSEFLQYKELKAQDEETDPINWWKVKSKTFPVIGKLARKYLCVPATSTPAERVFSNMGLIITKLRNRLSPSTAEAILFLKKNNFGDFKDISIDDL